MNMLGKVFFVLVVLFYPAFSFSGVAPVKIKSIDIRKNSAVDITFEKNFLASNVKPSLERNFYQLVLHSAKLDAAKILPFDSSKLSIPVQKVFAYSYSPEVVRVRLLIDGKAEKYKGLIKIEQLSKNKIRLVLPESSNRQAAVIATSVTNNTEKAEEKTELLGEAKAEEKKIIEQVKAETNPIDLNDPESVKQVLSAATVSAIQKKEEVQTEVGLKKDPSRNFLKMSLALLTIVGLFTAVVFALKKFSGNFKKLPFGKKERLIQIVATHYLGSKKSISLAKVAGEYLVIGVSNDGISLISKLDGNQNVDKYLEDRFWGGTFEKHLDSYSKDVSIAKEEEPIQIVSEPMVGSEKVELSSFKASIKGKINSLKPLDRTLG